MDIGMRAALLGSFVILSLATAPVLAQSRPQTTRMSCGQARALVLQRGAILLGTGGYTYDRFVRDRSFCQPTEVTRRALAPTVDDPQCLVGYTCEEPTGRPWPWNDF
jgi:hypothetical protein